MNETGNTGYISAQSVPLDLIPGIIIARSRYGAYTPIGRRLSMLAEQIKNGVPFAQTVKEINQLKLDGNGYIHSNHGAAR